MSSWESFLAEVNNDEQLVNTTKCNDIVTDINKYLINYTTSDELSLDNDITFSNTMNTSHCSSCNATLYKVGSSLVCKKCGLEEQNTNNFDEEDYSTSAVYDGNVRTEGFLAFKLTGKGSYGNQRSMLKTCASYKKYRKSTVLKDLKNWNIHSDIHIPKNVITEANEMFAVIKDNGYVFRKDGKKGVLSACLYYACHNNGISKTPYEISKFYDIEEKFHSFGIRILQALNALDIIKIPEKINPIISYISRYMTALDIPIKYTQFVIDLIEKAEEKKIHIIHDNKNNSKVVGAIYMLIERVPELRDRISKEIIEKECKISKTTFLRYYKILCKYHNRLRNVFKRHHISMKKEWRRNSTK